VIAGGGRVGSRTAHLLDDRGHDVTVIERDRDLVEALSDEYVATVIHGDATRPSILRQANLDRADVIVALTGEAGRNLAVCMAAQRLDPGVSTVMRTDESLDGEYDAFVDEVIFPERAGARAAANAVERDVRALEDVTGNLEIMEVRVAEGAPVAGRTLTEVALPRGSLVVSDADGHRTAGSETELVAGRSYVVAVEPDVADEVVNLFRG
jgi:trk system potassium uptake protein TrkA